MECKHWSLENHRDLCEETKANTNTFYTRPRPRPRPMTRDQDFSLCPREASIPRPWSRGLQHWLTVGIMTAKTNLWAAVACYDDNLRRLSWWMKNWLAKTISKWMKVLGWLGVLTVYFEALKRRQKAKKINIADRIAGRTPSTIRRRSLTVDIAMPHDEKCTPVNG